MINRKAKQNLGQKYASENIAQASPPLAAARTGMSSIEFMLFEIMRGELEALRTDADKRDRYLRHLFDPVAGAAVRDTLAKQLANKPPNVVYGYARQGAEMPCIALVLEDESEEQNVLGDYVGESLPDERGDPAQYVGSMWNHGFAFYIYAEHPVVCAGFYQIAKMILLGARQTLVLGGLNSPTFAGTELAPNPEYIPENIFVRVLRVHGSSVFTVPEFGADPANFRVAVYSSDVIVDGLRGSVGTFAAENEDD